MTAACLDVVDSLVCFTDSGDVLKSFHCFAGIDTPGILLFRTLVGKVRKVLSELYFR